MSIIVASVTIGIVIISASIIIGIAGLILLTRPSFSRLKKAENALTGLEKDIKEDNIILHDQLEYSTAYDVLVENTVRDDSTNFLPPYTPPPMRETSNKVNEKITGSWRLSRLIQIFNPSFYTSQINRINSLLDENDKLTKELDEKFDTQEQALSNHIDRQLESLAEELDELTASVRSLGK